MTQESYHQYITSKEWIERRSLKLSQKHFCEHCLSIFKLHVHHATYKRIGKELDSDLFVLCESCHEELHRYFEQRRKEIDLMQATKDFLSLRISALE